MTGPQPRASVRDIPPYVAGRPPVPRAGLTAYKLSSNEVPFPPLPGVLEAATRAAATLNRYPDFGSSELYAALADHLGVPADHLALGTGSSAVLFGLVSTFCEPGDEVVYPWRSFEAYPSAVFAAGATPVPVPLLADGRHDLAAMAAALTDRTRVLVLCTPNNPTGPALTQAEVDELLAVVPEHVLVVLDEAYVEFVRSPDPVDGLATHAADPRVLSMRTFSKAYGLAGLRVGYAVAHPEVSAALRATALPFGVSSIAQAAAVASLAEHAALVERVEAVVAERARMRDGLLDQGWQVPDAQGNFVWVGADQLGARGVAGFAAACEEEGLMVRPLGADGVRVTVGEPEATDRLLALCARLRAGGGAGATAGAGAGVAAR